MENKITYQKVEDYFIPNIVMPKNEYEDYHIGKYGHSRLNYLKQNKSVEHNLMIIDGTLRRHIAEIDMQTKELVEKLVEQFKEKENITEALKANNQMEWVCRMNNIKNRVEEIVYNELIYV